MERIGHSLQMRADRWEARGDHLHLRAHREWRDGEHARARRLEARARFCDRRAAFCDRVGRRLENRDEWRRPFPPP